MWFAVAPLFCFGRNSAHSPQLLLTPQRLRRLERDRDRQTVRWVNFENRVQSVPDSPERGFELALYYAITHDEKRGREAIDWAIANACQRRQVAVVLDWVGALVPAEKTQQLGDALCPAYRASRVEALRDALFIAASLDRIQELSEGVKKAFLESLESGGFENPRELYAACEFIDVTRTTQHVDVREDAPPFFSILPTEFLLTLKPKAVEHPEWMAHIAALALVNLDPNLPASQYVQGWAIEDRQMVRDGPGVAYELLWGNPYLPGVGYQNLDPWVYDDGRLFARSDWNANACWIRIAKDGVNDENCPPGWRGNAATFGHMTLIPMTQTCLVVPHRRNDEVAIVWKLRPQESVSYYEGKKREAANADAAGLWRLSGNIEGKICVTR